MAYRLHWNNGRKEIVEGKNFDVAFRGAGYDAEALGSLDYYEPVDLGQPQLRVCVTVDLDTARLGEILKDTEYDNIEYVEMLIRSQLSLLIDKGIKVSDLKIECI